ncbi:hypothetical protein BC833DRAFT_599098 [Globomyces pollinis-pini]|nr:hypothetical protein BC833DRAFT_599098 [Globomyces pollinis-pini]
MYNVVDLRIIEKITIGLIVLTMLMQLYHCLFLCRGIIPNRIVTRNLLWLTILTFIWNLSKLLPYASPTNVWLIFFNNVTAVLTTIATTLQNLEIFKLLTSLMRFWTTRRVNILQACIGSLFLCLTAPYIFLPFTDGSFMNSNIIQKWSIYGASIVGILKVLIEILVAFYLSHIVRIDSLKERENYLELDKIKFARFYRNLQRNLFVISTLEVLGLLEYLVVMVLQDQGFLNETDAENLGRIGSLQMAVHPIIYSMLFLSILKMKFSVALRITETPYSKTTYPLGTLEAKQLAVSRSDLVNLHI